MQDIKFIRQNQDQFQQAVTDKGIQLNLDNLLSVDTKRLELLSVIEALNAKRNQLNEAYKIALDKESVIAEGRKIKEELEKLTPEYEEVNNKFLELMAKVPTIPSPDTPKGKGEEDNVEIERQGELPKFDFQPLTHIELGQRLDILDLERGVKVSGYRGYYLKNEGAMLVMALMMFALNKMVQKGFLPMIPPTIVKEFALFGSGYFKGISFDSATDEVYQLATVDTSDSGEKEKDRKFLVGTAEPSLLAYYSGEVLSVESLPMRICGFSPCYRSEIGSYGKDTKGIYRVHEFFKVEQVVLAEANIEAADKLQAEMVAISKEIHEELGLPYRLLQICTGDMSAGKYKSFDIEAWMPGLNRYGETGSASNFLDWQSRRLDVKYQDKDGKKRYIYMLNNTALPSPRVLIAILENFQQADKTIKIPKVLHPFTGFTQISPK